MEINIAELLKNCPKGMELNCALYEDVYFDYIDKFNVIYCYIQHETHKTSIVFNPYGTIDSEVKSKCVIFPKGKTTWEGFHRPFKDGDIVAGKNYACSYITIFRKFINNDSFSHHVCLTSFGKFNVDDISDNANLRFATKEEKQKLFDAIKDKGYKWNPETKTLEKLVKPKFKVGDIVKDKSDYKAKIVEVCEDDECYAYESLIMHGIGSISFNDQDSFELVPNKFDITTLKPFESKVLVRSSEDCFWEPAIFGFCIKINFYVLGGSVWSQCIPYEGNEHLLGTTEDCAEFYKTW